MGDMMKLVFILTATLFVATGCFKTDSFVNWESAPVHPVDITPDGNLLIVANTPDNRIEVFSLNAGLPVHVGDVPVGLDPVSVRVRSNTEVWVVNHISDSVSIIDLTLFNVVATLATGDEPSDVIFAGSPERAYVSVSQENCIKIYDPADLSAPPLKVNIAGQDPRALASDGERVYAAIFQSGNNTTALSEEIVSSSSGPHGGENPPPNCGDDFCPPINSDLTAPPPVGLIVRKTASGNWLDDNAGNWDHLVDWDLNDNDVAIIPTGDPLSVTYAKGLMNIDMALTIMNDGRVAVVGTDATNHIRFESRVNGTFIRVALAAFSPANTGNTSVVDLNPHLTYTTPTISQSERSRSVSDPRSVVWSETDNRGYVSGMGSNNVVAVDSSGQRLHNIEVGAGPAGMALDEDSQRLYVLNRFDASISIIDLVSHSELSRISFYDPTPEVIRSGRPLLYDAHQTSGLGHVSCGSCHVDGRTDQIAWDLGDPGGEIKPFNQICDQGECEDWHPMKGPMTTQTLFGIIGTEPLHWRGDKEDLAAFSGAFVTLMGDDAEPSDEEMEKFESYLATLRFPPNPFRNFDNSVQNTLLWNGGNPAVGESLYHNSPIAGGSLTCNECHAVPTGSDGEITAASAIRDTQSMKVPQLRNIYEKTGFSKSAFMSNRGFGFVHDGSIDTLFSFFSKPVFEFPSGETGDQQRLDIEAFVLSFSTDTHAAVGVQATLTAENKDAPELLALLTNMMTMADREEIGMVVKGLLEGLQRGAYYMGGNMFQMDRKWEKIEAAVLHGMVAQGNRLTVTAVPFKSRIRIGVDRDEDGMFDRDELDKGKNPADPIR